jgi:hypothetical protein
MTGVYQCTLMKVRKTVLTIQRSLQLNKVHRPKSENVQSHKLENSATAGEHDRILNTTKQTKTT